MVLIRNRHLKCEITRLIYLICLQKIALGNSIVQTSSGPVRGVRTLPGVEAFLGIPYAEPPVGDLRFAKPVPKKPWTEVLEASKYPPPCPQNEEEVQYHFFPELTNMSEDCLYLNVWTPRDDSDKKLKAVIIFVHHGGFYAGASGMEAYDGGNFAKRGNVVFASFNYRLGPLGFFLAYTDDAPGNMGMYDQILAMKWVKENAELFGGDPENIVLMGPSSGAASVSAHMVSPISKGLFHKAIIQSGSIILKYFFDNTHVFKSSKMTASITGCSNRTVTLRSDPDIVVDCLKRLPVEALLKAEAILLNNSPVVFFPTSGDEFLPRIAVDYFREGQFKRNFPVLMGFNKNEGTLVLSFEVPEYFGVYGQNQVQKFTKNHAIAFARGALFSFGFANHTEIVDYYVSLLKSSSSGEHMHLVANLTGDYFFTCNTLYAADLISLRGNPVYFYKFGFRSKSSLTAEWMGTTHLDELQYVFGNPYNKSFTEKELEISNSIIQRWSNFAKTGNPNIAGQVPWLRYSYRYPLYLNIEDEESIRLKPNERCDIWRKPLRSVIDSELIKDFLKEE